MKTAFINWRMESGEILNIFNMADDFIEADGGSHNIRIGGDYKLHNVKTNLPEEQGTEFEKIEHFQQLLLGFTSEADTQFGFTDKDFLMQDASWFLTDDWRISNRLTASVGVRWELSAVTARPSQRTSGS